MNPTIHSAPAAGFVDPVQQSQQAFRCLLEALAHPGRVTTVTVAVDAPSILAPAIAAALLTLCDLDTPVWLGPGLDEPAVAEWLRFHTGAPLVPAPQAASIALVSADAVPKLDAFNWGSDVAPELGATLLIQVPHLTGAMVAVWQGPGIQHPLAVPDCGLSGGFWRDRAALGGAFPRGLDIYIAAGADLIGLPRSTRIQCQGA